MKTIYMSLSILTFAISLTLQISNLKCPVFSIDVSRILIFLFVIIFVVLVKKIKNFKPKTVFILSTITALTFSLVNANGIMMNTCLIESAGRKSLDKIGLTQLSQAISRFSKDKARIPSGLQELVDSGYIEQKHLVDPWGNQYRIGPSTVPGESSCKYNGASYEVSSNGADGTMGTNDDLTQSLYCK